MLALIIIISVGFAYKCISVEFKYRELLKEKENLTTQLTQEKDKLEQLDNELIQVESDEYIEMLARKYFGLVYPEEKVIIEVNNEGDTNN